MVRNSARGGDVSDSVYFRRQDSIWHDTWGNDGGYCLSDVMSGPMVLAVRTRLKYRVKVFDVSF